MQYTRQQTERWLTWLARAMKDHGQTLFDVEWMQPDWLPGQRQQRLVTLLIAVMSGLGYRLGGVLGGGLACGLGRGLFVGLACGLRFGGHAYLHHFALRLVLWYKNYAPLNYIRFLDYATDGILLRKVGAGYIFLHRMLLEYFADPHQTHIPHPFGTS